MQLASPTVPRAPDRRAALKARHRAAILGAARQLVEERGGPHFSADELAERADIARRTVFNHFSSIDEVLLTLCADALDVIIDDFVKAFATSPVRDDSLGGMFDEIAAALGTADLPGAIMSIAQIIGTPAVDDTRGQTLSDQAFARAAARLLAEVTGRHPAVDPLDAELLVNSLMSGVIVIAKHWILRTGVRLDDESRAEWSRLLDHLSTTVRTGYTTRS